MQLDFKKMDGLVAAVIQDWKTNEVLMVGFMNEEAWKMTLETGFAVFYSRTRNKLWLKGETSGHKLVVKEITTDCDLDTVLLKVEALGPGVCHDAPVPLTWDQDLDEGELALVVGRRARRVGPGRTECTAKATARPGPRSISRRCRRTCAPSGPRPRRPRCARW